MQEPEGIRSMTYSELSDAPKVGACLVARNAEATLADCLANLRPFVDEINVVDLASADRTAVIAREYGAKVVSLLVEATAETARRLCSQTASAAWLLWLDPWDIVPESIAEQLKRIASEQSSAIDTVNIPSVKADAPNSSTSRRWQLRRAHADQPDLGGVLANTAVPLRTSQAQVDVIVLSYAKTAKEYAMTAQCLRTLRTSETAIRFNVIVVETNTPEMLNQLAGGQRWFDDECRVIFPRKGFNYNEFLQIGFAELAGSTADSLLIINNDVVFEAGFAKKLLHALQEFDSVSPWCPDYHERFFDSQQAFHAGYRTSFELCGWTIMFRKSLLKQLPFHELFPTDFEFWFQDNYYGWQLQRHGARHALVSAAIVHHAFQQSHDLLDHERRAKVTTGAQEVFRAKITAASSNDAILLTVAIPSLPSRAQELLPQLFEKLARQAEGKPVEIISLMDNKWSTLGAKRNALLGMTAGQFISFVDDDDDVADDYIDSLLATIRANPESDCITLDAWVSVDGDAGRVCKYGIAFGNTNEADTYFRQPNHVCCFRADIARRVPWDDVTWGEDSSWAKKILPHIHRETRIDRVLYWYRFDSRASEGRSTTAMQEVPGRNVQLTIAVLSVASRVRSHLRVLIEKLTAQASGQAVEVLALIDNKRRSIGAKRNILLGIAKGRYTAYVDDDDEVANDYVASLLHEIDRCPGVDCISFDAWVTIGRGNGKVCHYGLEFANEDHADAYYRQPNHLCCIRTELAKTVAFPDVSWHEDFKWAASLAPKLRSECRIDKILYWYRYDAAASEATPDHVRDRILQTHSSERNDQQSIRSHRSPDRVDTLDSDATIAALPIFGFMHIATLNHWREVVAEQLLKLRSSGLWDRTNRIFVGVLGNEAHQLDFADEKIQVIYRGKNIAEAEFPTLEHLQQFCGEKECLVYYIHTKGVFRVSDMTRDWRHLMEHFVIQRFEDCLEKLTTCDVCGVDWETSGPHFAGNFWWARSSYIRALPQLSRLRRRDPTADIDRHICEKWIGMNPSVRAESLHQSEVNHYHDHYPRSKYASVREVPHTPALDAPSAWRGLENRFQDLLAGIGPIRTVVEVGVEYGYSLFSLAAALPDATIIGIDPYGDVSVTAMRRLERIGQPGNIGSEEAEAWVNRFLPDFQNVILLRATAEDAARMFTGRIDVLHLDAIPTYEDVRACFEAWEPKIRPGGCVLFHDIQSFESSVGRFFRGLAGRKAEIEECHGLGAWYKPK